MNWARKSRLLRFWSKFEMLSNGYIFFNISTLIKQAMMQNKSVRNLISPWLDRKHEQLQKRYMVSGFLCPTSYI